MDIFRQEQKKQEPFCDCCHLMSKKARRRVWRQRARTRLKQRLHKDLQQELT
jgi:hypothetical protein